jgi:pre-mRNA-processing factor SLU7
MCTERPRKVGAKYTQRDFANDEYVIEAAANKAKIAYEAKRDRWNGYDSNAFKQVVDEWNLVNEEGQKKKA